MRKIICCSITIMATFGTVGAYAQESASGKDNTFEVSGQLRSRFEYRDGDFRPLAPNEDPAMLVLNRVRLYLDYSHSDILKTKITIQNVNIWGEANPMQTLDKSGNSLGIFEAWADFKLYGNLRTKIGRQTISLDDERIFGVSNWTNSARSHDALSFYVTQNKFQIITYFAFNQNYDALAYNNNANNPTGNLYNTKDAQAYKTMQTLWAKYNVDKHSYVSFLFSNIGFQNADSVQAANKTHYLQTAGINYFFNYPKLSGNLSAYYQFGKTISGTTTSAYLLAANIGTKIKQNFKVNIGLDYLSGNTMGSFSSTNNSFNTLFHTGHKFYGNMDYFYAGSPFKDVGLMDNYLSLQYNIQPKTKLSLTGHLFYATTEMKTINLMYEKSLGQEIDLSLDYKMNKFIDFSAGYSLFNTNASLMMTKNVVNGSDLQHWAWVSCNIQPEFLKSSFK